VLKDRILVLAGVGVDTIVRVDTLTVPPGDSVSVGPIIDYVAHTGNGVALGFHALGIPTTFIDHIGDDAQGRMILDRYAQVGLDFRPLPAPIGTARSVNLVDAKGRRFSFYDGRHPEDLRIPRDVYLPVLETSRHVHVSCAARALDAFADAQRLGISTSTDVHAWDGAGAWAVPFVRNADVVFLSAATLGARIGGVMAEILDAGRAGIVVATDGEFGSMALARGGELRRYPIAAPERPVVDSNGAGDAFSTAFLSRWLDGHDLDASMLAGAVSGAYACGAAGTHEELITEAELAGAIARQR
jgi:acarbose 7IV-phosphotransferase